LFKASLIFIGAPSGIKLKVSAELLVLYNSSIAKWAISSAIVSILLLSASPIKPLKKSETPKASFSNLSGNFFLRSVKVSTEIPCFFAQLVKSWSNFLFALSSCLEFICLNIPLAYGE